MAKNPLFSAYRQGENRVTSSMLAVFQRIDLSLLETLLGAASGETGGIQLVSFVNQPGGRGASVPDGRISAAFDYWFEVKTTRGVLREEQLRTHLQNLGTTGGDERLFVVTPDSPPVPFKPQAIEAIDDDRVVWFGFESLSQAIDDTLDDGRTLVPEQTRFLLRELQALLFEDGLLDGDDVVIVAARIAYPEYLRHSAYVCQPNRSFREGLTHLGFYAESAVQQEVARIEVREPAVPFTQAEIERRRTGSDFDQRIADLIVAVLNDGVRPPGNDYQVFLLSKPESPQTVHLQATIVNDQTSGTGKPVAWTMGQRYVSLERLMRPGMRHSSDLIRP